MNIHDAGRVIKLIKEPGWKRGGQTYLTGLSVANDINAVTIVIPADGPSLGVAPSGTCI
jgi:hypothetical protein